MLKRLFTPACCIALVLGLTGCQDEDIKRAPLAVGKSIPGELFWFQRDASTLIVLTGASGAGAADDMATALAWPDRIVLVLPQASGAPEGCRDLVTEAATAVQGFAAKAGRPKPSAPIVIGLDGTSAMSFAQTAQDADARAVVALNYCPGVPPQPTTCAGPAEILPTHNPMPVIAIPAPGRCTTADLAGALAHFDDARAITPTGGSVELISSVVSQVLGNLNTTPGGELDLPLIELPATGQDAKKDDRLAIILSGDGGWADIDRQLGEELSKRGVAVVGFDTLKYFWRRKEPAQAAADLERVIAHYSTQWNRKRVVLIGYSFGADVLPFLWENLSTAARAKVSHVALLALSAEASFEITVGGWVGVESKESVPTAPAIRKIAGTHVLCVQAAEDTDDPCPGLKASGVEALVLPGDHHFDRDYKKLSTLILTKSAR
jgi:type IV secretory pathway VirJ component